MHTCFYRKGVIKLRAILRERFLTGERFYPKIIAWVLFFLLLDILAYKYYIIIDSAVYPIIHLVLEFTIVVVAICASLMSWYDYKYKHELKMLIISLTFCIVAPVEFVHALSYLGMPDFITPNSVNKASTFFMITKLLLAAGLFSAVFSGEKMLIVRRSGLIPASFVLMGIVIVVFVVHNLSHLAAMYDPVARSQTAVKIFLSYLFMALEALAAVRILLKKGAGKQDFYLGIALLIVIMSDMSFTHYNSPYDTYNLLGHIYQLLSFAFIFKAIIDEAVGMIYENNRALERQWELLAEKNRQLQEADQIKDEFLANTNHELRTPLSAIIAFTEMLLDEGTGKLNELQKDYLSEISDSSKELLGRINGFLDLSKIAAGKTVLYKEEFEVAELFEDIAVKIRPLFNQKGITLEIPQAKSLIKIWADREKVGQVLTNLLSNALKFTAPGGRVLIEAGPAEAGHGVNISVIDSGIGIDTSDQEKIFQPFQQVDGTSARKYSGTGIGLTLARKLVDLHGGSIWVSSEINNGSKFTFTLPAREKEEFRRVG